MGYWRVSRMISQWAAKSQPLSSAIQQSLCYHALFKENFKAKLKINPEEASYWKLNSGLYHWVSPLALLLLLFWSKNLQSFPNYSNLVSWFRLPVMVLHPPCLSGQKLNPAIWKYISLLLTVLSDQATLQTFNSCSFSGCEIIIS